MSENNSIKPHGGVLVNRITKVDSTGLFSIGISEDLANDVENIADVENLDAHKLSVTIRQTK